MIQPRTIKRYAGTILAQGAILVLGVASGILSARLLGPDGRGTLLAIILWPSALAFLFACGMNQAIVFHVSKLRYTYSQIYAALLVIGAAQSVLVALVGVVVLPVALQHYPPAVLRLGLWFLAFTPVLMLGGYSVNVLQALRHSLSFNIARSVAPATFVAGLAVLAASGTSGVGRVLTAQIAAYWAALLIGLALLLTKVKVRPELCRAATRELVAYGARAQATNVTTYFNQRCDQLVLSVLVPPRELGLYAVAVTLAMAVTFVPQAAGLVTFADGASQGADAARRTIATSFRLSLTWLTATCILLYLSAPFLITLAFGNDFAGASTACRILVPGMVAAGLNQVLYAGANALGQPALPSLAELVGMILTIGGLVLLVPRYGYIAAAVISTVSYATSFAVMLCLSADRLSLNLYALLFKQTYSPVSQVEMAR